MPKKLAVLVGSLVLALVPSVAAPALAQVQDEVPACELDSTCLTHPREQKAADQYTESPVTPAPEVECDGNGPIPCPPNEGIPKNGNAQNAAVPEAAFDAPASCGTCGLQVARAAQNAINGGEFAGSDGTSSADAFGAALQAARHAGGTREAAASEEAGVPTEETAIYRAAFEAAKEAGADDETAKEAAEQAVVEAEKGGGATDKSSKAGAAEEQDTEDTGEEAAVTDEEDGGTGGEDAATTPAGSRVALLLGGVALLAVGGYAGLGFVRSWSPVRGRRLLRS